MCAYTMPCWYVYFIISWQVWGLFAPKFVFDVVGLILSDVLICLASLFSFGQVEDDVLQNQVVRSEKWMSYCDQMGTFSRFSTEFCEIKMENTLDIHRYILEALQNLFLIGNSWIFCFLFFLVMLSFTTVSHRNNILFTWIHY